MVTRTNSQVMLDIETLSTRKNAAIVSIGAVVFSLTGGVQDSFYVNIDPADCKKYGLHIDKDSIDWWCNQSPEARASWQSNPQPLKEALVSFLDWYGTRSKRTWSKGSYFDFPILENAILACGLPVPWKYWDVMDYRTICNVLYLDERHMKSDEHVHHNALSDCKEQLKILLPILKSLTGED